MKVYNALQAIAQCFQVVTSMAKKFESTENMRMYVYYSRTFKGVLAIVRPSLLV